ncbi:MAG: hypothetical protein WDO24_06955 [Pseudomonadota bacterium]
MIAQAADVVRALDIVEADDAERIDIGPGIDAGDHAVARQRDELVQGGDARAAGIDQAGHPLIDADAVGIAEAQRAEAVDMEIDPARSQIMAGQIDGLGVGGTASALPTETILPSATRTSAGPSRARAGSMTWAFFSTVGRVTPSIPFSSGISARLTQIRANHTPKPGWPRAGVCGA